MHALGTILMTPESRNPFEGLSILVLEDDYLIALDAEGILQDLGFAKVEVVNSLESAARCAEEGWVNLAVLDVNINGEMSFPLAQKFLQQGVPVVFASGYELTQLLPDIARGTCLTKPYTTESMKRALLAALAPAGQPGLADDPHAEQTLRSPG
jgi:CheY-like chemotaxis protein